MDLPYLTVIYGPVFAIFILGLALILQEEVLYKTLAVVLPVVIGGTELVVLFYQEDLFRAAEIENEFSDVLFVQGGALGIVSLIFLIIIGCMWVCQKISSRRPKEEVTLGVC